MNTHFFFKGLDVDDRTREYILKRLSRVVKLVDEASEFSIEVDKDKKGKFRVEVMIREPHELFRAEEETESVEGSMDLVVDELENQIVKFRNKKHDLKVRGGRSIKKKMVLDEVARF